MRVAPFLVKPVSSAIKVLPESEYDAISEGGIKKLLRVDDIDDGELLTNLFMAMYDELPEPKPKKKKKANKNSSAQKVGSLIQRWGKPKVCLCGVSCRLWYKLCVGATVLDFVEAIMHKNGKWAKQILEWQNDDGSWGDYHSLAVSGNSHITTEQALRRLERLGYTIEDECIQKAVQYMSDCLAGKRAIPDRVEKCHDWNVFTSLILSTGIRRFTKNNNAANKVAENWAEVVTAAFEDGSYNYDKYVIAYKSVLRPNGGRIIGIENYYPVSLLCDRLDEKTELAYVVHILNPRLFTIQP